MTDSPLAILQAANLYVYGINNPVRWNDPSGLSVIGAIIRMAQEGNDAGAHALAYAVVNGSPISIAQSGNNVGIVAFVDISGGHSPIGNVAEINRIAASLGLPTRPEHTHREAVVHGLANLWAGSFDGLNVSVTIIERGNSALAYSPGQAFLSIDIIDGGGVSRVVGNDSPWSITNPGRVMLFTHHGGGGERTFEQAAWTAAHELGHAMGIGDGWGYGYPRVSNLAGQIIVESIYQYGNIISMMTKPLDPVTRFDVEMALRAHRYNEWQTWNNNPLLPLAIRR